VSINIFNTFKNNNYDLLDTKYNSIINKEENTEATQELAHKIMASEKEMGIFDSNNWQALQ